MVNFQFVWDTKEISDIAVKVKASSALVNKQLMRKHIKKSMVPLLKRAKANAPVGGVQYTTRKNGKNVVGAERISLKTARRRGVKSANYYRRGGATKRDIRSMVAEDKNNVFDVLGLVGVSKRKGKVGWRTHFITRPITLHGKPYLNPKHDFLDKAYLSGIGEAKRIFNEEFGKSSDEYLNRKLKNTAR